MKWFNNLKIGRKLLVSLMGMMVLMGLVIAVAYQSLQEIQATAEGMFHREFTLVAEIGELKALLSLQRAQVLEMSLNKNRAVQEAMRDSIQQRTQQVETLLEDLAGLSHQEAQLVTQLQALRSQLQIFRQTRAETMALILAGKTAPAQALATGIQEERFASLMSLMQAIDKQAKEKMQASLARSEQESQNAMRLFAALSGLALLMALGTVLLLNRLIARPLADVTSLAEKIAAGRLDQAPAGLARQDEIGQLSAVFDDMLASLREIAQQNLAATENLNTATAEILASTQQQASSTKEQATAVHQTTATMEEVRQSGAQITERARQVASEAEMASTMSEAGLQSAQDTVATMEAIREQVEEVAENIVALSEKNQAVGEIIATVTDIAEQSNLLALNAAIEAASAGEHGRSFSVVASEMKNLADQAKGSTVQIRAILSEIQKGINTAVMLTEEAVKRVESGKQKTDVAEATIRQMTDTTRRSIQAFQQIVAATNQQQIGFDQVNQALQSIRLATEQTAVSTNQLEKAIVNLNALGQQLRQSVARYKL